jgi:uncharacterized protein YmfQ (DUF2313 family)
MPVLNLLAADFLAAMQRMLPTGRAWPREPDAVQTQVLGALAPAYERQTARSNNLLVDAFPATTVEQLPEWEATLGLPDPCAGPDATLQQRQEQVVARLTARGGQSVPYFATFATTLGYPDVTITQFAPARADLLVADAPVYDLAWAFAWQVTTSGVQTTYFSSDASFADEPLVAYGSTALACELGRLRPAHTVLFLTYAASP